MHKKVTIKGQYLGSVDEELLQAFQQYSIEYHSFNEWLVNEIYKKFNVSDFFKKDIELMNSILKKRIL